MRLQYNENAGQSGSGRGPTSHPTAETQIAATKFFKDDVLEIFIPVFSRKIKMTVIFVNS